MTTDEDHRQPTSSRSSDEGLSLIRKLDRLDKERSHILISCSKTKGDYPAPAKYMYRSSLFSKSRKLAEEQGLSYSILSAKHGLVAPDDVIDPYDVTLKGATKSFKVEWARNVSEAIAKKLHRAETLIFLAGNDYISPLKAFLAESKWRLCFPLEGHSLGLRLSVLDNALRIERRRDKTRALYTLLEQLSNSLGLFTLSEIVSKALPMQGVYFFLDPNEVTSYSEKLPRLVRIGTHAVSAGSKATLRSRLRTHAGSLKGSGNHRGSIFRLHVGQALIARDGLRTNFPHWGRGQSAQRDVTVREDPLERQVSAYLAKLLVLYIPVTDEAGIHSMRASIEKQLIALLTENLAFIEAPSATWLGRWSNRPQIKASGLWNVRCVGDSADLRIVEVADRIAHRAFLRA